MGLHGRPARQWMEAALADAARRRMFGSTAPEPTAQVDLTLRPHPTRKLRVALGKQWPR